MGQVEHADEHRAAKRTRNRAVALPIASAVRKPGARHYSTTEKIRACGAMLATNPEHPYSNASIEAAKQVLNAPQLSNETLGKWMNEYRSEVEALLPGEPSKAQLVAAVKDEVLDLWTTARNKALTQLNTEGVIEKASARDLAVIGGITQDHIHKLHKLSAERTARIYALLDACQRVNYDYDTLIDDMIAMVESKGQEPPLYINATAEDSTDTP